MLCNRCGGIFNDKQTIIHEGEKHWHYYCSWKNEQEKKAKFDEDFDKKIKERREWIKKHGGDSFFKEDKDAD